MGSILDQQRFCNLSFEIYELEVERKSTEVKLSICIRTVRSGLWHNTELFTKIKKLQRIYLFQRIFRNTYENDF